CRGGTPGGDSVASSAAAVTARTWGLAYLQANQLPQAEAEFEKVVKLAPDQAVGYADLGLVYLREGRYRHAEAPLRRAAALRSARAGRATEAAAAAKRFHQAMEVTAAYQVSLQRLGGRSDPLVGYPVLTFNQNLAVPTQDARSVAAEIRFRDVTAGSGLESVEALPDSVAGSLERAVALAVGDYDDDETEDLFV